MDRPQSLLVHPGSITPVSRGDGVESHPYVGAWNSPDTTVTTGMTVFDRGRALPLHTHNVDESVLVLDGRAVVTIGEDEFELAAGASTWVPAGVPHRFANAGADRLRIFWIYSGRHVTRTICATGQTVDHLSQQDRGAIRTGGGVSATAEVEDAERRRCAAIGERDHAALSDALSDRLRYVHSTGVLEDKDAYIATSIGGEPRSVHRGDLDVRLFADVAVVTGDYVVRIESGRVVEATGLQVWVREAGRWRLLVHQGTPKPNGSDA